MSLNLPEGCQILMEDVLADNGIKLLAARKSNSKRKQTSCLEYLITNAIKLIETAFSDIAKCLPKRIHAVTDTGFLIKLIAFIWGYTFDKLYKS